MTSRLMARALLAGMLGAAAPACLQDTSVPPRPIFQNMIGTWQGTLSTNFTVGGTSDHRVCDMTLSVASQESGQFAGTFQLTGSCSESGVIAGEIVPGSELHSLQVTFDAGASPCTLADTSRWLGAVAGVTLHAQRAELWACSGQARERHVVMTVTKVSASPS